MHSWDLEELIRKYSKSLISSDILIARRLKNIAELQSQCKNEERIFANEITVEFCRVIQLINEQHEKELAAVGENIEVFGATANNLNQFIAYNRDVKRYDSDEQVLFEFHNYALKNSEYSTVLDYKARISTFANRYLKEIFPEWVGNDPVLFVYDNIEFILAKFNTKNEEGKTVKQRLNMRSALRKLNEFKNAKQ